MRSKMNAEVFMGRNLGPTDMLMNFENSEHYDRVRIFYIQLHTTDNL